VLYRMRPLVKVCGGSALGRIRYSTSVCGQLLFVDHSNKLPRQSDAYEARTDEPTPLDGPAAPAPLTFAHLMHVHGWPSGVREWTHG